MPCSRCSPWFIIEAHPSNDRSSISRNQVACNSRSKELAIGIAGEETHASWSKSMSDVDIIVDCAKSTGSCCIALCHQQRVDGNHAVTESILCENGSAGNSVSLSPAGGTGHGEPSEGLLQHGRETRKHVSATAEEDVLVAFAWTSPLQHRLASAFPELIVVDGTCCLLPRTCQGKLKQCLSAGLPTTDNGFLAGYLH